MIHTPTLDWWAIAPELCTAVGAMIALLVGMGRAAWSRVAAFVVTLVALGAAVAIAIAEFHTTRLGEFSGQIDSDELANVGRIIAAGSGLVVTLFAWRGRARDGRHGEFHALLLAAVCGMGLFAAAGSFVSLFVALELFSISLYVLCALDADREASLESGLKYLIVGGLSSAILLYGTALVFGAAGTLDIAGVGAFDGTRGGLMFLGAAMVLGGLVFKVSAAPVHWWTVDVYEGAGTPVTAFMSVETKAVAFLALARVLVTAFPQEATAWMPVVAGIATASIIVGNIGAIAQSNLKRMLGFSSIAQAGYLLFGIVGWQHSGLSALVYALFVYAVMTLGSFAYVIVVERDLGRDATYADLAGRGWISADSSLLRILSPLAMAVCAFSLAGIPPTSGFFSKFGLFTAVMDVHDYEWLALVGAVGSVFGLAYYLRIVIELYVQRPDRARADAAAERVPGNGAGTWWPAGTRMPLVATLAVLAGAGVLVLAFVGKPMLDLGCDASESLLVASDDSRCDDSGSQQSAAASATTPAVDTSTASADEPVDVTVG
jgi:NADH-quinone oxidoreductase subunit N